MKKLKISKETKTIILGIILIAVANIVSGFCCVSKPPVTETYVVKAGDTLEYIAEIYIPKNTYSEREQKEFIGGIIELNIEKYPEIRYSRIYVGDELKINYWVKDDENN